MNTYFLQEILKKKIVQYDEENNVTVYNGNVKFRQ